ncbi:Aste57867_15387 [Aphanomyces stellatus]|uniref:Aste57867_15387 protein n=1 Tax=Aphanomyces stellatus TaxID=120398 RepID=A0A485L409_9STRA|nr:hypothetical protein As57867_015331 [Aphanomyces stellatus]VFT92193.1 Aste57867_15387 [Aphanomyces stellatus]
MKILLVLACVVVTWAVESRADACYNAASDVLDLNRGTPASQACATTAMPEQHDFLYVAHYYTYNLDDATIAKFATTPSCVEWFTALRAGMLAIRPPCNVTIKGEFLWNTGAYFQNISEFWHNNNKILPSYWGRVPTTPYLSKPINRGIPTDQAATTTAAPAVSPLLVRASSAATLWIGKSLMVAAAATFLACLV